MVAITPDLIIDVILGLLLVGSGFWALFASDLFEAVVLFIVFGLLMALAWIRLQAPDVALAEAAIGAGLTGALFLNAARSMEASQSMEPPLKGQIGKRGTLALLLPVMALIAIAAYAAHSISPAPGGVTEDVMRNLVKAGVEQPVTAVLLNFRGYDTWMELAVLFVALVGANALHRDLVLVAVQRPGLPVFIRTLAPMAVIASGYLLWAGTFRPGGAFQAGAILGAVGILLVSSGLVASEWIRSRDGMLAYRVLFAAGLGAFLFVAVTGLIMGGGLLEYPAGMAGLLILIVEFASTLAIGLTLCALFILAGAGRESA